MKTSAIDYLVEYVQLKEEDAWLQSVVSCYLNSKEKMSDVDIQKLANNLLINYAEKNELNNAAHIPSNSNVVLINKVKHQSGFNAIAENQEIVFNENVTVLFGLNGSGKSSYFRILQAMIGNINNDEVIPNIYLDETPSVHVNLEYSVNGNKSIVEWFNDDTINDLKTIKVFDSEYSKNLLGKRQSDEQVLYPYKLYVFSRISSYIDKIKEEANKLLEERERNNILPEMTKFLEREKEVIGSKLTLNEKEHFLLISENFDEERERELSSVKKQIHSLLETNYKDKLDILESKLEKIDQLKKHIEKHLFFWIDKSKSYEEQHVKYQELKARSIENQEQTEVLSNLPSTQSDSWKAFVRAGLSISAGTDLSPCTCPYCFREYNDNAIEIVNAYSIFIHDKTEVELSKTEANIEDVISKAMHAILDEDNFLFEDDEILQLQISKLFEKVSEYLDVLTSPTTGMETVEAINFDTSIIESRLSELKTNFMMEKKELIKDSSEKEKKLEQLKKRELELSSEKSIHQQIDTIVKYIDECISINELRLKIKSVSSNKITRISKRAHEDLLTKQLMVSFNDFLKKFEIKERLIELKSITTKGVQQTELVLKNENNLTKILSEGEQKAVSIALFLAEIEVSKNKSTIILDDPVNSLDHMMMERLSNVLLKQDNQIVVLTHNRMFLDSLSGSDLGHVCKNFQSNGCNKSKGKHIFNYQIRSEGQSEKGIVTQYVTNTANDYLRKGKSLLDVTPFEQEIAVCAIFRNAIDCIIDEVIFNNQIPRKYSMKGIASNINWNELKKMAVEPEAIDRLKDIFGRLSSGQLHRGQVSLNDPIGKQELLDVYNELEDILRK